MSICKELIDVAVDAGCDAVKFQKRDLDEVYTQGVFGLSKRKSMGKNTKRTKTGS